MNKQISSGTIAIESKEKSISCSIYAAKIRTFIRARKDALQSLVQQLQYMGFAVSRFLNDCH